MSKDIFLPYGGFIYVWFISESTGYKLDIKKDVLDQTAKNYFSVQPSRKSKEDSDINMCPDEIFRAEQKISAEDTHTNGFPLFYWLHMWWHHLWEMWEMWEMYEMLHCNSFNTRPASWQPCIKLGSNQNNLRKFTRKKKRKEKPKCVVNQCTNRSALKWNS